jgi:hypothetical protein
MKPALYKFILRCTKTHKYLNKWTTELLHFGSSICHEKSVQSWFSELRADQILGMKISHVEFNGVPLYCLMDKLCVLPSCPCQLMGEYLLQGL